MHGSNSIQNTQKQNLSNTKQQQPSKSHVIRYSNTPFLPNREEIQQLLIQSENSLHLVKCQKVQGETPTPVYSKGS